jgi:RecG-like helicase
LLNKLIDNKKRYIIADTEIQLLIQIENIIKENTKIYNNVIFHYNGTISSNQKAMNLFNFQKADFSLLFITTECGLGINIPNQIIVF